MVVYNIFLANLSPKPIQIGKFWENLLRIGFCRIAKWFLRPLKNSHCAINSPYLFPVEARIWSPRSRMVDILVIHSVRRAYITLCKRGLRDVFGSKAHTHSSCLEWGHDKYFSCHLSYLVYSADLLCEMGVRGGNILIWGIGGIYGLVAGVHLNGCVFWILGWGIF